MKLVRLAAAAGLLVAIGTAGVATAGSAAADPYPSGAISTASINSTVFTPGQTIVVTLNNVTPGRAVGQIFSAPTVFGTGTVVASADGQSSSGTISGPVPAGYVGAHTVQATSAGGDIFTFAITVNASGTGSGSGAGGGSGNGNGGGLANTGAAVTGIGVLGGILVAGGVFFVVAGRRRTANQTPSV